MNTSLRYRPMPVPVLGRLLTDGSLEARCARDLHGSRWTPAEVRQWGLDCTAVFAPCEHCAREDAA